MSSLPEAMTLESGIQAMMFMPARWPSRVWRCLPVLASHILIVASAAGVDCQLAGMNEGRRETIQQLAIKRPSGENLTAVTARL